MQLDDNGAALNLIELLAHNLAVEISDTFLSEPAVEQTLPIVEYAEAQVVHRKPQPHQQHQRTPHHKGEVLRNAAADGHDTQNRQPDAEDTVALGRPDGETGAVLGTAAEGFGKQPVHGVAHAEDGRRHQKGKE